MSWTRVIVLALLATLLILAISRGADSAAVRDNAKSDEPKGAARGVFMPGSDASNFFRRRTRRSVHHQAELQAEQRVRMTADERRREYNEERRDEFENFVEEERDEQYERTREKNEQWRQFNYDGRYPRYFYSY